MAHAAARTETMKRTLHCPSSASQSISQSWDVFFGKRRRGGGMRWTYRVSLGVRRLDLWY